MMNNKLDTFIKYYDGELSNSDRENFEKQLVHDTNLKAEFELFSELYTSSKNKISADDRYFTTLLPNAKKKISTTNPFWENKYKLVLPLLIVGLIFLFLWPVPNTEYENYNNLLEMVSYDDELVSEIINGNPNYFIDDQFVPEIYDEDLILDESVFEYLQENLSGSEINNELVDSFTEVEFLNLYEQILDKKIVGIK